MQLLKCLRLLVAVAVVSAATAAEASVFVRNGWNCTVLLEHSLPGPPAGSVVWRQIECGTMSSPVGTIGPLVFNTITANLSTPGVHLAPQRAAPSSPPSPTQADASSDGLQPLQDIAARVPGVLAGINGGYFWRVDDAGFVDEVTRGLLAW